MIIIIEVKEVVVVSSSSDDYDDYVFYDYNYEEFTYIYNIHIYTGC